jgi:hypothetical protein
MVANWKRTRDLNRNRVARIETLQTAMDEYFSSTVGALSSKATDEELNIQLEIYRDLVQPLEDEKTFRLQMPITSKARELGLDIPPEYYDSGNNRSGFSVLSDRGENWVRRQIQNMRIERTKNWVAIVSPILSAIIAILALIVALRKH